MGSSVTSTQSTPSTESLHAVTLDRVTVEYGKNRALQEVSAVFPRGAVGLLGPNGAGKSTMLKSLLGFIAPTSGSMQVLGLDVAHKPLEIRGRLGYMPENDAHIPGMNAVSFVAYCAQLSGLLWPTPCSARTRCSTTSALAKPVTGTSRPTRPA